MEKEAGEVMSNEVKNEDTEQQRQQPRVRESESESEEVGNEQVLRFLDSVDDYLTLIDSLSSTLRQGWLELASGRHSMGALRVNSTLLDMNSHSASTSLHFDGDSGEDSSRFVLRRWGSFDDRKCSSIEEIVKEDTSNLRRRGDSRLPENNSEDGASIKVDDQVKKERSKSLSVFGTLVSPKLRAAQTSFESALETLVEMANTRSVLLSTYAQVCEKSEVAKTMN